jgi:hypothetical protein
MNTIYDTEYKIEYIKTKCKNDTRWVLEYFPEYISYWFDFVKANPWNAGCINSFSKYLDENGLDLKSEPSLMDKFKKNDLHDFVDWLDEINYWGRL